MSTTPNAPQRETRSLRDFTPRQIALGAVEAAAPILWRLKGAFLFLAALITALVEHEHFSLLFPQWYRVALVGFLLVLWDFRPPHRPKTV